QGGVVVGGGRDVIAAVAQGAGQPLAEHLVVVDEQDRASRRLHDAPATGSHSVAVVPAPGAERMESSPPSRSTMARARKIPSPIPFPAGLVVKKGSPTRARRSGEIPAPRSATSKTSRPLWLSAATRKVTGAPG